MKIQSRTSRGRRRSFLFSLPAKIGVAGLMIAVGFANVFAQHPGPPVMDQSAGQPWCPPGTVQPYFQQWCPPPQAPAWPPQLTAPPRPQHPSQSPPYQGQQTPSPGARRPETQQPPSQRPNYDRQGQMSEGVRNAIAQGERDASNGVVQAGLQAELSGRGDERITAAGYGRGAMAPPNSIGDFFGGRSLARRTLLPIAGFESLFFPRTSPPIVALPPAMGTGTGTLVPSPDLLPADRIDYFRQLDGLTTTGGIPFTPDLGDAVLLPVINGNVVPGTVTFQRTGETIPVGASDIAVVRAENLVLGTGPNAVTSPTVTADEFTGFADEVPNVIVVDPGPFVAELIDAIPPGPYADGLGNEARQVAFTEDTNGNGVLDPGEDLNMNGVVDPIFMPFPYTEVYGLYREIIVPNPGDVVGRVKIGENNNPIPRDRVFFDYTFYDNAGLNTDGVDVHRLAPGFEKTFWDGLASIDVRVPLAMTLESDITSSLGITSDPIGLTNNSAAEVGDVSLVGKFLLERNQFWALSAGCQVTLPTASDVTVRHNDVNRTEIIRVENESVHVMPFLAALLTPNERLFVQCYGQYDYDATGSPVSLRGIPIGTPKDTPFVYGDVSAGYWMYRKPPRVHVMRDGRFVRTSVVGSRGLTGFAPRIELHYNRSVEETESTHVGGIRFGEAIDRIEFLNMNLGATMQFGGNKELTVAWGAPIANKDDSDFDTEVRIFFNWVFPE